MKRVLYDLKNEDGHLIIDASLTETGGVEVFFHDIGAFARKHHGDDDLERWVTIPQEQLGRLAISLLADRFSGGIDALSAIEQYCRENNIETTGGFY